MSLESSSLTNSENPNSHQCCEIPQHVRRRTKKLSEKNGIDASLTIHDQHLGITMHATSEVHVMGAVMGNLLGERVCVCVRHVTLGEPKTSCNDE